MTDKRREAGLDPAADRVRDRRTQTYATLVPLIGLFLLMPPFVHVFVAPVTVFGAPLIVVYIFGVWAGLIAAAFAVARRLSRRRAGDAPR